MKPITTALTKETKGFITCYLCKSFFKFTDMGVRKCPACAATPKPKTPKVKRVIPKKKSVKIKPIETDPTKLDVILAKLELAKIKEQWKT